MKLDQQSFSNFAVGDTAVFDRTFEMGEFEKFASLSGDHNPLHYDKKHASKTNFGAPIVPLHMTMSPLSMFAGMVFPGEPSLYLGHEVRAIQPIYYGQPIRYSAQIISINDANRILTIRVLALCEGEVVLDATLRVQAQVDVWMTPSTLPVRRAGAPMKALVTGASGEIGGAIASLLARQGWNLLLQDRGDQDRRQRLSERLAAASTQETKVAFVSADLTQEKGRQALVAAALDHDDIALIVHVASSPLLSPLDDLVGINYVALKDLTQAILPNMLALQNGAVISLGSLATERSIVGWENYAAAKAMAAQYVSSIDRSYAAYGVRGIAVMPGLVATPYSKDYQGAVPALSPQEVAEAVVHAATAKQAQGSAVVVDISGTQRGQFGFHVQTNTPSIGASSSRHDASPLTAGPSGHVSNSEISSIVRKKLGVPADFDLTQAGLGTISSWDSLRHIELILELEMRLGVHFTSSEIESCRTYAQLEKLCLDKLGT